MSKVVIVRCESYEISEVKKAVQKGLDLLGGVQKFAKKDEKILFKVNLLIGEAPEKCVNTHPAVFRAVAEIFKTTGALLSYGDSPSFGTAMSASKKLGMEAVADEIGVALKEFQPGREVHFADGIQNKKFTIANAVLESDVIISMPKLKSHGFEKFTGAVKNQFGCIPGLLKGEFHVRVPNALDFAKMLVDLDRLVHPRLYIMDGIIAMEGNGPRGGDPRKMNVLLFSEDPIALDATACRLINLDPALVPTITFGQEAGHGKFEVADIELVGDEMGPLICKDFDIDRSPVKPYRAKGAVQFLSNLFVAKPVIHEKKCIKCGICIKVCPTKPKSVDWDTENGQLKPPRHNYHTCLRCYCCQELCPEKAIDIRKPLLRRVFGGSSKKKLRKVKFIM